MAADFSCIPCCGPICFQYPVAERKACARERHPCPDQQANPAPDWLCRCCEVCERLCEEWK